MNQKREFEGKTRTEDSILRNEYLKTKRPNLKSRSGGSRPKKQTEPECSSIKFNGKYRIKQNLQIARQLIMNHLGNL